ncbi:centrosomal protein of 126 kDa [Rhinophrynus dorsalis]
MMQKNLEMGKGILGGSAKRGDGDPDSRHRRKQYKSNHKTELEIDLDEEHQALLEEQKIFRIRAQKLSIETNRRRKALEERRREEEEKEERFREEILQQRKLKLQEATEKFQRAHLPPSQRRRSANVFHKKQTPKLEDALEQIQGPFSSTFYYLSNNKYPTNTRTTDTPPSSSAIGNGTWPRKPQPGSKLGYDKSFQESSATHIDSNQLYFKHRLEEAQRLLEEQHLSNLQNFHQEVEQLAHSESLSSLDSLEEETGVLQEQGKAQGEFSSTDLHRALSAIPTFSLSKACVGTPSNNQYVTENRHDLNGYSNTLVSHQFVSDRMETDNHLYNRDQVALLGSAAKDTLTNTLTQNGLMHSQNTQISATHIEENFLVKMDSIDQRASFPEQGYKEYTTSGHLVSPGKAWVTPNITPSEAVNISVPQKNNETIQYPEISVKPTVSQPLATPVVLPFSEWVSSASNCHIEVSTNSKKSKHSQDINPGISTAGTNSLTATNNAKLYSMKNDHLTHADTINGELLLHGNAQMLSSVSDNNFGDIQEEDALPQNTALVHPDPGFSSQCKKTKNSHTGKDENGFLKSILKKGSKYESSLSRALSISKMLHFGDKNTNVIRDSVELIKEKENKKTNNKKLRWIDEIDKILNEKDVTDAQGNVSGTSESQTSPDYQACVTIPNSAADQTRPFSGHQSSVQSTGYHFTKQAWGAPKVEEKSSTQYNHNNRCLPKGKTKVVRRPKSAKNQSTVTYRNRKGTIIRPQSATEASKIVKSQGKLMTPHPPSKSASSNINSLTVADAKSQTVNSDIPNVMASANPLFTKDTSSSQSLAHSSGNLMAAHPYNPHGFEPGTKPVSTLDDERAFNLQERLPASAKRYPMYGENGLRLDHTPTDEEIALLWQGVRSALTNKNAGTGAFHPGDLPSNMQPARTNLSHVIIDGGNLLSNFRSFSRMNGFFSPSNNGHITLARRKQIVDSSENKRRALMEQRRTKPGSAGWRPQYTQNQQALKINPFTSALEPGHSQVSESTAQFILAENLVETSATDGEILAAMQAMQAQKNSVTTHRAQHTGLSALSLEEQRLLQSLDRLNQRLQIVQEAVNKPPSATTAFSSQSPLNIQQFPSQPSGISAPLRRNYSLSADPRARTQRRY